METKPTSVSGDPGGPPAVGMGSRMHEARSVIRSAGARRPAKWKTWVTMLAAGAAFACGPGEELPTSVEQAGADPVAELASEDIEVGSSDLTTVGNNYERWRVTSNFQSAEEMRNVIDQLANNDTPLQAMATTPTGEWIVVTPQFVYRSSGFPSSVLTAVNAIRTTEPIRAIDFNPAGGWIVAGDTRRSSGGSSVPSSLLSMLQTYENNGWPIRDVEMTNSGYLIIGSAGRASYQNIDSQLAAYIYDRRASRRQVQQVEIGFDGRWVAVAGQEPAYENISDQLRTRLQTMAQQAREVTHLMLGVGNDYIVYSRGTVVASPGNTIEALEYDLDGQTLWQRMSAANVPGLSIALIQGNRVTHARGYGVLRTGQDAHVLATTPFDLASLSKFLGALTVARLETLSTVEWDRDILTSPGPQISNWELLGESNPEAYGIPDVNLTPGMTLRRLLRHNAGIAPEGGSSGFQQDQWHRLPNLSAAQLLLGFDCTGSSCGYTNPVWRAPADLPGGVSDYASGNYMVVQAALEDETGDSVAELMANNFFLQMGLNDITGQVPPPAGFLARTAWQHAFSTPVASRAVYPWVFGGGVHGSAKDYAEMMILALNGGRDSAGVPRIISRDIDAILEPGDGSTWGLGVMLDVPGAAATEGTDRAFWHRGLHTNRARTWMCGNPTRDEGIVILTNTGDNATALVTEILDAYVQSRGWPANLNCR